VPQKWTVKPMNMTRNMAMPNAVPSRDAASVRWARGRLVGSEHAPIMDNPVNAAHGIPYDNDRTSHTESTEPRES
jgi:hypothetical protein